MGDAHLDSWRSKLSPPWYILRMVSDRSKLWSGYAHGSVDRLPIVIKEHVMFSAQKDSNQTHAFHPAFESAVKKCLRSYQDKEEASNACDNTVHGTAVAQTGRLDSVLIQEPANVFWH